ncbi:MAG: hypothetical protein GW808_02670 [Sphingomonadales bacterium]|nr:hypothetical protein [Sphingomonadales bacterium]NCO48487.1 hypothetical protein [Sphingomonadales bacterium]NCO99303.1 hypothetical protein [Sphingomonadales bacterium]NCP27862.1 hypothetical protein [Sphingomonadales bacterium]NCP42754.1 hypothetical protein [Sphingomonadales bacterium]
MAKSDLLAKENEIDTCPYCGEPLDYKSAYFHHIVLKQCQDGFSPRGDRGKRPVAIDDK